MTLGAFGQQLKSIGLFVPFTFHPLLFVSHTTLASCRLTCPHEHLGWQLKGFAGLLGSVVGLSASLGLLRGEDVPQLILKFVFVSQRFFLLIVHCLLQKQRLGS